MFVFRVGGYGGAVGSGKCVQSLVATVGGVVMGGGSCVLRWYLVDTRTSSKVTKGLRSY